MKKFLFFGTVLALLTLSVYGQEIDTESSEVIMHAWHGDGSEVLGTFGGMTGKVVFNPAAPGESSFQVCIDPSSIKTGSGMRDWHLRSKKYLRVKRFPSVCFTSSEVRASEEGFVTRGTLQLLETSREVEIPFTYSEGVLSGKLVLNRFDYGIDDDNEERVASRIETEIKCVLVVGN